MTKPSTSSMQRKVHHPDRSCSASVLCGRSSTHMSHYAGCGENERGFIREHVSKEPTPGTVCEAITIFNSNGLLCHNSEDNKAAEFLRLIGCLYLKKHYSAVVSLKSIEKPQQLLHSFPPDPDVDQHKAWYNAIWNIVSDRIMNEEERMPSPTALWQHWLCSCWVAKMWYIQFYQRRPVR